MEFGAVVARVTVTNISHWGAVVTDGSDGWAVGGGDRLENEVPSASLGGAPVGDDHHWQPLVQVVQGPGLNDGDTRVQVLSCP